MICHVVDVVVVVFVAVVVDVFLHNKKEIKNESECTDLHIILDFVLFHGGLLLPFCGLTAFARQRRIRSLCATCTRMPTRCLIFVNIIFLFETSPVSTSGLPRK